MVPQGLEKIESAPGNGMGSEVPDPQDMVRERDGAFARAFDTAGKLFLSVEAPPVSREMASQRLPIRRRPKTIDLEPLARHARPRAGYPGGALGDYPAGVGPGCTGQAPRMTSWSVALVLGRRLGQRFAPKKEINWLVADFHLIFRHGRACPGLSRPSTSWCMTAGRDVNWRPEPRRRD